MGNNLFNANISGKILAGLGGLVLPAKMRRYVAGSRDPAHPTLGTQGSAITWPGLRGFVEAVEAFLVGREVGSSGSGIDTTIQATDRKITILGDSIPKAAGDPRALDEIQIEGRWSKVVGILSRDPDRATFVLIARG